jgi:monoamine oxidase
VTVDGSGVSIAVDGERVRADAVILAVPHDVAAQLAPPAAGLDTAALARLGASPIVNLHVWFDRRVTELPLVAGWATPLQWIFDRTRASGAERGQVLTVSLSAAHEWLGKSRAELREVFLPAFARLFPAAREAAVLDFAVQSDPAATFHQVPGTRRLRPAAATRHPAGVPGRCVDRHRLARDDGRRRAQRRDGGRSVAARTRSRAPAEAA